MKKRSVGRLAMPLMLIALSMCCVTAAMAAESAKEQANRKVVLAFTKAMSEHNLAAAAAWLDESLIEHNPNIAAGKKGYMAYFGERWKDRTKPAVAGPVNPLVVAVAEGDKVVLVFRRPAQDPSDPTKMVDSFWFDAYRVEKGKIAEHWDSAIRRAPTVTTMPVTPGTEATK